MKEMDLRTEIQNYLDGYITFEDVIISYMNIKKAEESKRKLIEDAFDACEKNEANNSKIGDRIKSLIEKKNMTQRELAKECGITEVSMCRYISNDRVPKATVIIQIANALDVSADYLLGME